MGPWAKKVENHWYSPHITIEFRVEY